MKRALIFVIVGLIVLGSISLLPILVQGQVTQEGKFFAPSEEPYAYQWHYLNDKDLNAINKVRQGKIGIVDGHGTGFKVPSSSEFENLKGKVVVVEKVNRGPLRDSLDISQDPRFPAVGDQGHQGSCAAWAVTYYNEGWIQAYDNNWTDAHTGNNKAHLMSPAWTYNKVNGGSDSGSSFYANLETLRRIGGATMATMPYNDQDYISWGDEAAWREAPLYRIQDWEATYMNTTDGINVIKSWLDQGYVVNFAIDANQYDNAFADGNFIISSKEYDNSSGPNHAQTIVGYDDSISDDGEQGAFKVVNSWGSGWGNGGYYWITYKALMSVGSNAGYPYAFRIIDYPHYEPKLLAVWTLDPAGTRITPVDLGIGSPNNPIEVKKSLFGNVTSYNGGDHPFPNFLAVDITEFMSNFSMNSQNEFFIWMHKWSKVATITSFQVEYYPYGYIPGEPYQISDESPDVPVTQDSTHDAIARAYLRPIQTFHIIKIDSNADFTSANGVIGGNGTQDNPYIIGWWDIDAQGGNYAIQISNTTAYFVITHCYLHNTSNGGVVLNNVTNGYLLKNRIYENFYGVLFSSSHGNTLASNVFYSNDYPVYVLVSPNKEDFNQTIYPNNTARGKPMYYLYNVENITLENLDAGYMGVFHSTNVTLKNITLDATTIFFVEFGSQINIINTLIKDTHSGLVVRHSDNINISGSYFINNTFSTVIYATSNGVIENNTFLGNYNGLRITNSNGFVVYHNNFVDNTLYNAYDNSNSNQWYQDPPIGGNYWYNYSGDDTNGDGFGDQPYNISGSGGAQDMYPLVIPWDTIPPKLAITMPENGVILNTADVTVYWNGSDNTGIDHYEVRVDNGEWINVGNVDNYTFTGLSDGDHIIYVTAYDISGNNRTESISVTVDTTPPEISIIAPNEGSYINSSTVVIRWSVEDLTPVGFMLSLDGGMWTSVGEVTEFTLHDLQDGAHNVALMGIDKAGNQQSAEVNFFVDTIAPTVEWNMTLENNTWINTNSVTLSWNASDNVGINYLEIKVDNNNWTNVGNGSSYTLTNLTEGAHTVILRAYDYAGNTNETSIVFKVDTEKPTVHITSPENDTITNEGSVEVTWSGSDNIGIDHYEIRVDNGNWINVGTDTSYTLNMADGRHTIQVIAVDTAGNIGVDAIILTVDTTAPSVEITSPENNENITETYVVVSWSGSDNIGIDHYEVRIDGGDWMNVGTDTSYNFTNLQEGKHTVEVKAVDTAGNTYTASVNFNIQHAGATPGFGLPTGMSIGILGGLIIIIIILAIAVYIARKKKTAAPQKEESSQQENEEEKGE